MLEETDSVSFFLVFDNEFMEEILMNVKSNVPGAFEKLLNDYCPMIHSIINLYDRDYGDFSISRDDLFQEGSIGLYEACMNYKEDRDTKFSSFAYIVIKRRIGRLCRTNKNIYHNESYSIDNLISNDHSSILSSFKVEETPLEYHVNKEKDQMINKRIESLRDCDKKIIELRSKHYSYDEIASMLNKNRKYVDNRLFRIKKRFLQAN